MARKVKRLTAKRSHKIDLVKADREGKLLEAIGRGAADDLFQAIERLMMTHDLMGATNKFLNYVDELCGAEGLTKRLSSRKGVPIETSADVSRAFGLQESPDLENCVRSALAIPDSITKGQLDRIGCFLLEFAYYVGRLGGRRNPAAVGRWRGATKSGDKNAELVDLMCAEWEGYSRRNQRGPTAKQLWKALVLQGYTRCINEGRKPYIREVKRRKGDLLEFRSKIDGKWSRRVPFRSFQRLFTVTRSRYKK